MPIKSSELTTPKAPPLSIDGTMSAPSSHDLYVDWHADDTERDPTPANTRRTAMYKETQPKQSEHVKAYHSKQLGLKPGPNKQ